MKNQDIRDIASSGFFNASSNCLDIAHAYKFVKAKRIIKEAHNEYIEAEKSLLEENNVTIKANNTLDGAPEDIERFFSMRRKLDEETVDVSGIKSFPYEEWRKLQKENEKILYGTAELALEGVLWNEPDGESEK